ncbi:hypothetical protein N7524_004734 [Penicillium chrysogenum]|nr:hypothetical protein N7524_005990 [Penicillium chrysogenum]KAJ5271465.1 hypothetical protein N7524_004734 [Penicillium chrysogenum]
MCKAMKRQYLLSLFRTIRGYRSLAKQYPAPSCDDGSNLAKRTHLAVYCIDILKSCSVPASDEPQIETMRSLFQGCNPTFKPHPLGWEAESLLLLSPSQQMCYYNGKLFGGYIALLIDRILADCCKSAVTLELSLTTN